jgi:membrane-bound lytic murein transglycosylase B
MTSMLRSLRTFAIAAATALAATTASAQPAADAQAHDHQDHAAAAPSQGGVAGMAGMSREVMARLAALDERIRTLATDMNMFTGELKVETMAALLTALVERQSLMGREMRQMHEGTMPRMMQRSSAPAAPPDEEPGAMCAPTP